MPDLATSAQSIASAIQPLAVTGLMAGCAGIIIGAAIGIGRIGSRAVESIARQPEAAQRIFMTMIIAAALIEGVTFFALLIAFLTLYWMR